MSITEWCEKYPEKCYFENKNKEEVINKAIEKINGCAQKLDERSNEPVHSK